MLGAGDLENGADLDYFDLEDLARLRRHVRKAIEDAQREREIYHDMVLQYLEVINRKGLLLLRSYGQAGLSAITFVAAIYCCCLGLLHVEVLYRCQMC